jgi:uncharacterized delta-60 repeat protein
MTSNSRILCILAALGGCFDPEGAPAGTEGDPGMTASTDAGSTGGPSTEASTSSSMSSAEETLEPEASSSSSGAPTDESSGSESGSPSSCGNGDIDDGEACDDGNDVDGDGCNVDCIESGTLLDAWTHDDDPQQSAFPRSVSVGPDGEFVIAGAVMRTDLGQSTNGFLRKYAEDGEVAWTRTYNNDLANGSDVFAAVDIDADGTIVVAGYEYRGDIGQAYNALLRRYDVDGTELWTSTYNTPASNSDDLHYGVGLDEDGNIYTGGYMVRNDLGQANNIFVAGWAANGENEWVATYDNPSHSADMCIGFAVDAAGNAMCAGYEDRADLGQGYDHLVVKTAPAGGVEWTTTQHGETSTMDALWAVAFDPAGPIVVAGFEQRDDLGQGRNAWISKLDTSGNVMWTVTHDGAEGLNDNANVLAVDALGNIIVGGYETTAEGDFGTWLHKLDPDGATLWTDFVDLGEGNDHPQDADVWPDGRIVVTGYVDPVGDDALNHIWVRIYAP